MHRYELERNRYAWSPPIQFELSIGWNGPANDETHGEMQ